MDKKLCLECQSEIYGRADKRFCDDGCRNNYNNRLNSESNNTTRNINGILRKNRRILEELLGQEKMIKVKLETLSNKGFNTKYLTHFLETNKGHRYKFIYEYGYLELENNQILIVKQKE